MRQFSSLLCSVVFLNVADCLFRGGVLPHEAHLKPKAARDSATRANSHEHHKGLQSTTGEATRCPMLELMSVSLDSFGSQIEHEDAQPEIAVSGDGHFAQPLELPPTGS